MLIGVGVRQRHAPIIGAWRATRLGVRLFFLALWMLTPNGKRATVCEFRLWEVLG